MSYGLLEREKKYKKAGKRGRMRSRIPFFPVLDLLKQGAIDRVTLLNRFLKEAKMAVLGMIEGLVTIPVMLYYGGSAGVAALVQKIQEWCNEVILSIERFITEVQKINPVLLEAGLIKKLISNKNALDCNIN